MKIECQNNETKQHNNRIYQYQQSIFAIYLQTPTNEPTNIPTFSDTNIATMFAIYCK